MQPKYCKFSPTAKNCLTTYIQLVGNVRSNTRDICFFICYAGQINPAWNEKNQILVCCFPTIPSTRTQLLSTLLTYTPVTLTLSFRGIFPANCKRKDKICLLQSNPLLLSPFSFRVRVTPFKKIENNKKQIIKQENNWNWYFCNDSRVNHLFTKFKNYEINLASITPVSTTKIFCKHDLHIHSHMWQKC